MDDLELKIKLTEKAMECEYLREKLRNLSIEMDAIYQSKYAVQNVLKIRNDDIYEALSIERIENRPEGITVIVR